MDSGRYTELDSQVALQRLLEVTGSSFEERAQLRHALLSRIVIEQAKGVLSERLRLSIDEAFEVLRRGARSTGTKLHVLARRVLDEPTTPAEVLDAYEKLRRGRALPADADPTAERVARNDATFREANEGINERARVLGGDFERVPFICECADLACTAIVKLTLPEYEAVRANSRRFFKTPGHEVADAPFGRVVERYETYIVLEKTGRAGEIATELDPRGGG